ncbi:hypothetical protein JOB18_023652 [Solea senegalensis]|uniref:Uncharacterized protein n=1 Tax=Solea senegalensis TaxID=28829 RepID=A0AAV6SRG0_SOLSE|nr:hypothetical protein JOB18_023652 [Solea senegalensis]
MASLCGEHVVQAFWDCADCPASGPQLHLRVTDYSCRQAAINTREHYSRYHNRCNFIDPPSNSTSYRNRGNCKGCGMRAISQCKTAHVISVLKECVVGNHMMCTPEIFFTLYCFIKAEKDNVHSLQLHSALLSLVHCQFAYVIQPGHSICGQMTTAQHLQRKASDRSICLKQ